MAAAPTFLEFFCGGGLARVGLGPGWRCLFANDIDPKKCAAYRANFGDAALVEGDVAALDVAALSARMTDGDAVFDRVDLAWASFPCQDLSVAGLGGGLGAARSGAFWPFWRLIEALRAQGRAPRVVVIENVCGLLTSRAGRDMAALLEALARGGYRAGALVLDAERFVPQSRPRLFVVGVDADTPTSPALLSRRSDLPGAVAWALPPPPPRLARLDDLLEPDAAVAWDAPAATARLLALLGPRHAAKLAEASAAARRFGAARYGAGFRRTRADGSRFELRFDGLAGCLRTPAGGSSRQRVLRVDPRGGVASRYLTGREAARLMGVEDNYRLPARDREALKLFGDGVAAPVVAHLARHLLAPLVAEARAAEARSAA